MLKPPSSFKNRKRKNIHVRTMLTSLLRKVNIRVCLMQVVWLPVLHQSQAADKSVWCETVWWLAETEHITSWRTMTQPLSIRAYLVQSSDRHSSEGYRTLTAFRVYTPGYSGSIIPVQRGPIVKYRYTGTYRVPPSKGGATYTSVFLHPPQTMDPNIRPRQFNSILCMVLCSRHSKSPLKCPLD